MDGKELGAITAIVIMANGLIGIVKMLISRAFPNRNNKINNKIMFSKMAKQINRLDELHAPKDANGIPLWYMPRSWGETQKEIAACLRDVSENQRRTLEIIKEIEDKVMKK